MRVRDSIRGADKAEIRITVDADSLLSLKGEDSGSIQFPESESAFPGEAESRYTGTGYDLAGIRQFLPGDIFRKVNRQATARTGRIYVNEYQEDRMLAAYIILDQTPRMFFTSTSVMKSVVAAETAVKILYGYHGKGHLTGGSVFGTEGYSELPETRNVSLCDGWVAEVAKYNSALAGFPEWKGNMLDDALERALDENVTGKELYIVSDFISGGTATTAKLLESLAGNNRLYLFQTSDRMEENLPSGTRLHVPGKGTVLPDREETAAYRSGRRRIRSVIEKFAAENAAVLHTLYT